MDIEHVKERSRLRDALQVFGEVVGQFRVGGGINRVRRRDEADRVTVGSGFGGQVDRDGARGAGAVLDDRLLPPFVGELLRDGARRRVGSGPGGERDEEAYGFVRITCRRIGLGGVQGCSDESGGDAAEISFIVGRDKVVLL